MEASVNPGPALILQTACAHRWKEEVTTQVKATPAGPCPLIGVMIPFFSVYITLCHAQRLF